MLHDFSQVVNVTEADVAATVDMLAALEAAQEVIFWHNAGNFEIGGKRIKHILDAAIARIEHDRLYAQWQLAVEIDAVQSERSHEPWI